MEDDSTSESYDKSQYTPEARRARFKRVAERRTNRILKDLRLLGNAGNKTLYQYDEGDIEKIFDIINAKLTETRSRFKSAKKEKPFTLGDD